LPFNRLGAKFGALLDGVEEQPRRRLIAFVPRANARDRVSRQS